MENFIFHFREFRKKCQKRTLKTENGSGILENGKLEKPNPSLIFVFRVVSSYSNSLLYTIIYKYNTKIYKLHFIFKKTSAESQYKLPTKTHHQPKGHNCLQTLLLKIKLKTKVHFVY